MKKTLIFCLLSILLIGTNVFGANYYVATNGNDSNNGSLNSPFKTLEKAVTVVSPGDYIYLRGGTYNMTVKSLVIKRDKSGTASKKIHVFAYNSEKPVLRYDGVENSSSRGVVQDAHYWHWKGITIERAGDNGMLLSGNNNIIENCVFRNNSDSGLQLSRYSSSQKTISDWPSNNLIVGCESYDNRDSKNEDADGFAAKLTCGTGNIFRDCIAHHNIDDGWDLYTKSDTGPIGAILLENCVAHSNGTLTNGTTSGGGDKNGFKLGSSSNKVNHILRRCIAFNNGKHGFTDNGNIGSMEFTNLTAYNNGDYNFHTRDNASHVFKNCVSFNGNHTDRIVGNANAPNALTGNYRNWPYVAKSSDFVTMTPGPNSAPTSNGFLNLKSGSPLIDAGVTSSGITYNGSAPDLGAVEFGGTTTPPVTPPDAGGGNTTPPATGGLAHNFTQSGKNSSFYNITGNLSTSKGTVSYNGMTLTQCLKIESSTSIKFNMSQAGTLTLVFNSNFGGRIKVDGTNHYASSGILNLNLSSGSHDITKADMANLYYMQIAYSDGSSSSGDSSSNTTNVDGTYSIVAVHSGKALDVYNWGTSDGTNIVQWDYWNGGTQQFNITNVGGEWHRITPVIANSKALDIDNVSSSNGANVHIWEYWSGEGQQFKFQNAGTGRFRIIPKNSGKCLDVEARSTANGANVIQWECISGATNQMFNLVRVKSSTIADEAKLEYDLYPNPSNGLFTVTIPSENSRLTVYDTRGMAVYSENFINSGEHTINSNLNSGVYIVVVTTDDNNYTTKIIIR